MLHRQEDSAITKEVAVATLCSSSATLNGHLKAWAMDITWTTVSMILRKIMKLYPYKIISANN